MIATNNIKHAAYYLSEGFIITDVEKRYEVQLGNTVYFMFKGQSIEDEEKKQQQLEFGTALVNIRSYLNSEITIRDIMYRVLQSEGKNNDRRIKRMAVKH